MRTRQVVSPRKIRSGKKRHLEEDRVAGSGDGNVNESKETEGEGNDSEYEGLIPDISNDESCVSSDQYEGDSDEDEGDEDGEEDNEGDLLQSEVDEDIYFSEEDKLPNTKAELDEILKAAVDEAVAEAEETITLQAERAAEATAAEILKKHRKALNAVKNQLTKEKVKHARTVDDMAAHSDSLLKDLDAARQE